MIPVSQRIANLAPYKPGRSVNDVRRELGIDDPIKLASNENPFGPSPNAVRRMTEFADTLHIYPDGGLTLRRRLAEVHQLHERNIICGSGSESLLSLAAHTFLDDNDEALTCEGTFVGFRVIVQAMGRKLVQIPLADGFRFDVRQLAQAVTEHTKIIYLANPNNPTGTFISADELTWLMQNTPETTLVILDEAYFEFGVSREPDQYPDSLQYRYDNALTLRTFSKAYGLAGMRIGYGIGHSEVIGAMLKVKLPFEPGTVAQSAGLGALDDDVFLETTLHNNTEGLDYYHRTLREMGLSVPQSVANFVMIDCRTADNCRQLHEGLLQNGVITRPLGGFGLPQCLRISIGTMEQNRRCIESLDKILRSNDALRNALHTAGAARA